MRSCSSVLMYVLAWKDGISGYRFILIGIGISSFCYGLVGYLLTHVAALGGPGGDALADRLRRPVRRHRGQHPAGRAGGAGAADLVLRRLLRALELGDDTARVLGTRTELGRGCC